MLLFESFKDRYSHSKKEKEKDLIQELGDEFVEELVADGDFEGLNFLLSTGFDLEECGAQNNLLVVALKNDKMNMFEYLLKNYADINTISLPDIIGGVDYDDKTKNKLTDKSIKWLKIITEYGFKFYSNKYNLIELYLTQSVVVEGEVRNVLWEGAEPFVDWLLTNYPSNYKFFKNIYLPDYLRNKYKDLGEIDKYNL